MKVISWNVFNGQGANPTLPAPSLSESIRETIASVGGDVLAVQEVDENQTRSGSVHQMEIIAAAMGAAHWGYARAVIGTPGFGWRRPNEDEKIIHSESQSPGYGIGLASKIPVRHCYAVDAEWLVPHFEKMLYDNAQLAQLYLDAFLVSGQAQHAEVVRDILDYVLRDLTHPGGGFFSAEDADSEGHEGKFYCWTQAELSRLLTVEEYNVAANYFGITAEGNFVDHSHPTPLAGQNVLSVVGIQASAGSEDTLKRELPRDAELLASARSKMLAARARRIRPQRDDKILASWNGLMLGAFARASVVLGEEKYRTAAEKNLAFLREKLWVSPDQSASHQPPAPIFGTLFHRWRDGERDQVQLLEGYAFLLDGVIQLYEATLAPGHLDFAIELATAMIARFYDAANGGFWQSPAGANDLILRVKDDYDGAEPSGNSVATLALLKLAAITGREEFRAPAEATRQLFAARLQQQPAAMAFMLQAVDFWLDEPRRVVIAGAANSPDYHALLRAAHSVYQPNKIVLGNGGAVEPFASTLTTKTEATAYVCAGSACQPPTDDAAKLKKLLE